jgi:1,4-alpha-glucan branching enzyme
MTNSSGSEVFGAMDFLSELDVFLFREGTHYNLYEKLGSHRTEVAGEEGTFFAVWAPNAEEVSLIGDFNSWEPGKCPMYPRHDSSGIWECFVPGLGHGALYKYHMVSPYSETDLEKGDPFAFFWELAPGTASIVWDLDYHWNDREWMSCRKEINGGSAPISIYELHLGSWRCGDGSRQLGYREIAPLLAAHVKETGFTHVEFLPIMEHPFYGSWGYQTVGYFAPTSRYGTPQDLMFLIDYLHQEGIGVILDWVPSHFPGDEYGLARFDGTNLYEHQDPRQGFHPDWKSCIFNYGRHEVQSFLISSAMFWIDRFHADGLRIDAVASMLYLDYSRKEGEWIPNRYGGRENLDAIDFLKKLNRGVLEKFPHVQMIAEESTSWPLVTKPVHLGGLGFSMKWNMGWMHDILEYMKKDPVFRKFHHDKLTFSIWYAFSENFVLPISHDEVVHGKGSLLNKMPGDTWRKFANLRAFMGYMYTHPGKKLLFMGSEIGQMSEWDHDGYLHWDLLDHHPHRGISLWVRDLNLFYRNEKALYTTDHDPGGFEWIDFGDVEKSIVAFIRTDGDSVVLTVCNFTPVPRYEYRIGVPRGGFWSEELNSDSALYGGSGHGNFGGVEADVKDKHGRPFSLVLTLPPLSCIIFRQKVVDQ